MPFGLRANLRSSEKGRRFLDRADLLTCKRPCSRKFFERRIHDQPFDAIPVEKLEPVRRAQHERCSAEGIGDHR
jgi:hypothetical protein